MRNTRYADQCPKPLGDSDFSMRNNKVSLDNPWLGCEPVSPGCDHCYAEVSTPVRVLGVKFGTRQPRHRTSAENWKQPLRWEREHAQFYAEHGRRQRVFSASLSDWLDNAVPIEWLVDLLDLVRRTPSLDWLLLTKRIGNFKKRLADASDYVWNSGAGAIADAVSLREWVDEWRSGHPPANVFVGATIVNQAEADRDIPKLLEVPAYVRFLSMEPLLAPVDISDFLTPSYPHCETGFAQGERMEAGYCGTCAGHVSDPIHNPAMRDFVDWVIVGCESGPHARPAHPDWVRSLRDQAVAAGIAFLFKQWGEWLPWDHFNAARIDDSLESTRYATMEWKGDRWEDVGYPIWSDSVDGIVDDRHCMGRVGKKAAGRLLDGKLYDGFPVAGAQPGRHSSVLATGAAVST
ncbi:hypothetical protein C3Z06_31230 (plasmid) [Cupriavidus metallidurans]|nr:hypothetical protein C3Z06_31230 [Cupriavidus metallidurans]